jgi:vitamin B12 transporter
MSVGILKTQWMKKKFGTLLFFVIIINFSAQEKTNDIKEVTVKSKFLELPLKRVNENITIISKAEIQNLPSKSIEEILAQFTGFDIRRRGGNGVQADISIRGSSFEQVLILINGIRMNDSQTGHNSMSIPFDLASVEKIEIVKGPAARRFGQNAFAGVVNIITKPSAENEAIISASGGDFGTYSLGAAANFANEKMSNFDYKINNIFYQNEYQIKNGNIRLQAGIQEKKFGANGFYSSPKATEQYEETQASIVSFALNKKWTQFNLNSHVYWRRGQDLYLFNRAKPEVYRNMHIGNNVGGEVNGSYSSNLGTTGVGVSLRKEFLASNNLGHRERVVTELFLEHYFSFFENKLQVTPGISWANFDAAGNFFYPGLDVGFNFDQHHKIYGNISKVNRIPTFTDLFYKSKTEEGNPNLRPESAMSAELGYRFQSGNFVAKMSGFLRNSNNAIDWMKASENEIWKAENIGNIEMKGFEVEIGQQFNSFLKSYSLGYTFIDNQFQQPENLLSKYVLENLKHQLVAKLENRLFGKLTNQLIYRYNERVSTGSYQILDEKLSYDFARSNVYVLVNNITNSDYTETFGIPMPKRWFHVGFTYKIGL